MRVKQLVHLINGKKTKSQQSLIHFLFALSVNLFIVSVFTSLSLSLRLSISNSHITSSFFIPLKLPFFSSPSLSPSFLFPSASVKQLKSFLVISKTERDRKPIYRKPATKSNLIVPPPPAKS